VRRMRTPRLGLPSRLVSPRGGKETPRQESGAAAPLPSALPAGRTTEQTEGRGEREEKGESKEEKERGRGRERVREEPARSPRAPFLPARLPSRIAKPFSRSANSREAVTKPEHKREEVERANQAASAGPKQSVHEGAKPSGSAAEKRTWNAGGGPSPSGSASVQGDGGTQGRAKKGIDAEAKQSASTLAAKPIAPASSMRAPGAARVAAPNCTAPGEQTTSPAVARAGAPDTRRTHEKPQLEHVMQATTKPGAPTYSKPSKGDAAKSACAPKPVSTVEVSPLRMQETGTLVVHLKSAKGLKRGDIRLLGGSTDAYVVVSAANGKCKLTSSTVKSSLSPTWDEELHLESLESVGGKGASPLTLGEFLSWEMQLHIYDRDEGKMKEFLSRSDDCIGSVSFSLLPGLATLNDADFELNIPSPGRGTINVSVLWRCAKPSVKRVVNAASNPQELTPVQHVPTGRVQTPISVTKAVNVPKSTGSPKRVATVEVEPSRMRETGTLVVHLKNAKGLKRGDVRQCRPSICSRCSHAGASCTLVFRMRADPSFYVRQIRVLGGSSDAYVVVSAANGQCQVTSSTVKSSLSPIWDEELRLEASASASRQGGSPLTLGDILSWEMQLHIYDQDTRKFKELLSNSDDLIGCVSFSLLPALATLNDADFDLDIPSPGRGHITISVHWHIDSSSIPPPELIAEPHPPIEPPALEPPAPPVDLSLRHAIAIDWAARHVGDDGCCEIERAWGGGCGLRQVVRITLRGCRIGDVGMCILARIAAQGGFRHLVRLDLSHNNIGDDGMAALAEALIEGVANGLLARSLRATLTNWLAISVAMDLH